MKRKILILTTFVLITANLFSQWQPQGNKLKTQWGENLRPENVLSEYPRPIMERSEWQNLNGLWEYAILPVGKFEPRHFDGKILVPFAVESSLSGVMKPLGADNELWYKRTFTIPSGWKNRSILLHFGAVDWSAEVYLNDIKIGCHKGGYTPFCLDITSFIKPGDNQKLVVKVYDGTDTDYQPRGKQVNHPEGIWYTPVSGIWQTVWLEPVNDKHIDRIKTVPDIDQQRLIVDVSTVGTLSSDWVEAIIKAGNSVIASTKSAIGQRLELSVPDAELWSPESPFLYDLEIKLYSKGKLKDVVKSYAAMRKISTKRDSNGIVRMQLNNKNYFHYGTLDQGWWPDGLYTAPTDEALLYDIQKTKDLGFNMIRKHVKVEPARWYTYCDRIGMLVWQDMPNGDRSPEWQGRDYFTGGERVRTAESEANYRKEWKDIMDYLISYPSIAVWVPFNEAWGQFKTEEIAEWTKTYDSSRLVNAASGGNHYPVGDILDLHNYPGPELYLYDAGKVNVLGEYGGIGLPLQGHLWQPERNWGYIQFKNFSEVTDEYVKYASKLKNLVKAGFSAAVYTQTTDVEGEVNGLITYDRKVVKVDEERIKKANREVIGVISGGN